MTISIDTNVIAALWWNNDSLNRSAAQLLNQARKAGELVLSAPVYAELMGDPARTEGELDDFLFSTGILVDWHLEEEIWREAGKAYQGYVARRRKSGGSMPRRLLADFVIGAHAQVRGYSLLTFDGGHYLAAFPDLPIIPQG
jgi:hypothetical protein